MIANQNELDHLLDREHTIHVEISPENPLPENNAAYGQLAQIEQTGFTFTPRKLLHAIGCKTAALPASLDDECLKSAWYLVHNLDLEGNHLSFHGGYGSDIQTMMSHVIGIGFTCLIAERYYEIPWDQLGPIPVQGKQFDYHGKMNNLDCIFEAKGTSNSSNQSSQIKHGIEKKECYSPSWRSF